MDVFNSAFGSQVRALQQFKRFSQEEVANRVGINVTNLSGIERGLRNPALKNIRKIALALGVQTTELFEL